MIFNFSTNNQFTTNVMLQDEPVEIVSETKLLGTIIQTTNIYDLKQIYTTFVRSKLEHQT